MTYTVCVNYHLGGGSFYEVDHIDEKQIPKAIPVDLHKLDPKKSPEPR